MFAPETLCIGSNLSFLFDKCCKNAFSVFPLISSCSRWTSRFEQLGLNVGVIVAAELQAEGCVALMKCYWSSAEAALGATAQKHSPRPFSASPTAARCLGRSPKGASSRPRGRALLRRLCIRQVVGEVYIQAWPRGSWQIDEVPFLNLDAKE